VSNRRPRHGYFPATSRRITSFKANSWDAGRVQFASVDLGRIQSRAIDWHRPDAGPGEVLDEVGRITPFVATAAKLVAVNDTCVLRGQVSQPAASTAAACRTCCATSIDLGSGAGCGDQRQMQAASTSRRQRRNLGVGAPAPRLCVWRCQTAGRGRDLWSPPEGRVTPGARSNARGLSRRGKNRKSLANISASRELLAYSPISRDTRDVSGYDGGEAALLRHSGNPASRNARSNLATISSC
jgi:hypothetical protein